MGGGGQEAPNIPGPTSIQLQAQQDTINLLNQFQQQVSELRPLVLEGSGFTEEIDQSKVSEKTKSEIALREQEISRLESEGLSAAQAGGLRPGQTAEQRFEQILVQNRDELTQFKAAALREGGTLIKTPQRLEQEKALKELQTTQNEIAAKQAEVLKQRLTAQTGPEAQKALKKQQELEEQFRDVTGQFIERQQKALAGELPVSQALTRQKQEQFNQFKEAQARQGNIILGNTPEEALAKGTGATAALSKFQERFGILEEQERRGVIVGENPLLQSALGQVGNIGIQQFGLSQATPAAFGQAVGTQPGFTGAAPNLTGSFGGLLAGQQTLLQPFQSGIQTGGTGGGGISPFAGALSGAGLGATIGTQFSPGKGTLFGALGGSLIGGLGTLIK